MYQITFKKSAVKEINSLPKKAVKSVVKVIDNLKPCNRNLNSCYIVF